jgi:hypothetical protein
VKTRRLLAVGYIKYRSAPSNGEFENGSATGGLQVHGLLVIDETEISAPLPPGGEDIYG